MKYYILIIIQVVNIFIQLKDIKYYDIKIHIYKNEFIYIKMSYNIKIKNNV